MLVLNHGLPIIELALEKSNCQGFFDEIVGNILRVFKINFKYFILRKNGLKFLFISSVIWSCRFFIFPFGIALHFNFL